MLTAPQRRLTNGFAQIGSCSIARQLYSAADMTFKEADIRPPELLSEFLRLNAEDGARLFRDSSKFQPRDCPGCGEKTKNAAFNKNGFNIVTCSACKSLFVDPVPTDEVLSDYYINSPSANYWAKTFFPAVAESRRSKIFRPRVKRVLSLITDFDTSKNHLIDVGAGAGLFLEEFSVASPKTNLCAVEPGQIHAKSLSVAGYEVFCGFASDAAQDNSWASSADVVTCFEVIEHVSDVSALIGSLRDLCRPGGIIIVSGLCGTGFDIHMLGRHSKAVTPPQHITFLSRSGVEKVFERCGLDLLAFLTPGELDVDIVKNAVVEDHSVISDGFVKTLVLAGDNKLCEKFQHFLEDNGLSSHMWIVARRPS